MGRVESLSVVLLSLCMTSLWVFPSPASAALSTSFYSKTCPNVETYVRNAVNKKVKQTFVTIPATLRLFFHDCAVTGCDASVLVASSGGNTAEKDHADNLSLAGDGFDTVIQAKKVIDADPKCKNKVSCADILALATRDVIVAAGGPSYKVELGRFDGKTSTARSVEGVLPKPSHKVDQLNAIFAKLGLTQTDMIALSGAHTLGFSHCNHVAGRIRKGNVDRTLNPTYAQQLQGMCPVNVDPRIAINMDPTTPRAFDNVYFKNLQQRKGLFTSDQDLWENSKSKNTVNSFAQSSSSFNSAFVTAMTKLGRVGVKTSSNGNIRRDCGAFN